MNYVATDTINFVYEIPPKRDDLTEAGNFHLEVHFLKDKAKKQYSSPTVEAPTSTTANGVTTTTPGKVTFADIPLPEAGTYSFALFYADNADLDANGVSITKLTNLSAIKIIPITEISG